MQNDDHNFAIRHNTYGHLDIVKFLLNNGADANKVDLSHIDDSYIAELLYDHQ